MQKLAVIAAVSAALVLGGTLASYAQTSRGAPSLPAASKNFTPIEKVACGGPGPYCGWGRHRVCRRGYYGRVHCWCAPC